MRLKDFFIFAFTVMLLGIPQNAFCQKKPVPIEIKNPPTPSPGVHRSPVLYPEVFIDNYTLTFDASCIGCSITLFDENENIVYTTIIDETATVELPDSLVGIFELQLIRNNIIYVGEIEW